MENQEAEAEITGYLVHVGFLDKEIDRDDELNIFENAEVWIYYRDIPVFVYPMFMNLASPFFRGFFNVIMPATCGRPHEVRLKTRRGLRLSKEVGLYCSIFEITREGE